MKNTQWVMAQILSDIKRCDVGQQHKEGQYKFNFFFYSLMFLLIILASDNKKSINFFHHT